MTREMRLRIKDAEKALEVVTEDFNKFAGKMRAIVKSETEFNSLEHGEKEFLNTMGKATQELKESIELLISGFDTGVDEFAKFAESTPEKQAEVIRGMIGSVAVDDFMKCKSMKDVFDLLDSLNGGSRR